MKVAILYDVDGWAYHTESLSMAKYMRIHGINCDIYKYTLFYSESFSNKRKEYDVVYLYPRQAKPLTFSPKKTIVKFSSFGDFTKQKELNSVDFAYIVCTNRAIYLDAIKQIGLLNNNIILLPLCIDHELFYPINKIDNKKLSIGFAGNAKRAGKGFDIISAAMEEVSDIAEFNTATYHEIDRLTRDKMPEFYRSLDLLICMSTAEGGPLTSFEAGMCGIPTISGCNRSAINEVTAHNYNAFHIDRTKEALVKEIIKLCKNRELISLAKDNIKETMFYNHSWKTQSRSYAELLLNVANK